MTAHLAFIILFLLFVISSVEAQPSADKPKYTSGEQLVLASFQLDVERVQSLLKAGTDPDTRIRVSPLSVDPDAGEKLFNGMFFPRIKSMRNYRWTPLLAVAYSRRIPQTVNQQRKQIQPAQPQVVVAELTHECDKRRLAIAKLLINQRANVDGDDGYGTTPLHVSLENGYTPLSLFLIESGANPNKMPLHKFNNEELATPVHLATRYPSVLKLILKHGASLTVKDHTGHTPLDWAAHDYHVESVQLLIAVGADVNARDVNGVSALYWVRHSKAIENPDEPRKKIVKLLRDAGARE